MKAKISTRHNLVSIQMLRAFAAISVLALHSVDRALRTFAGGSQASLIDSANHIQRLGAAGVDIFFNISGFVMIYAHYNDFGDKNGVARFIIKRAVRVIPIYWILTTIGVVILAVAPQYFTYHSKIDVKWVFGSYLFLMISPDTGTPTPVIGQGWTLDYEMFFYAVLAFALHYKRVTGLKLVFIVIVSLICVGFVLSLITFTLPTWAAVWCNSLLLEFLLGAAIGLSFIRFRFLFNPQGGIFLILLAFTLFFLSAFLPGDLSPQGFSRVAEWGVPAFLLVWGALGCAIQEKGLMKVLLQFGDASYSIYLFQALSLPILAFSMRKVFPVINVDLAAGVLFTTTLAISYLFWLSVEKPITAFFRKPALRRNL